MAHFYGSRCIFRLDVGHSTECKTPAIWSSEICFFPRCDSVTFWPNIKRVARTHDDYPATSLVIVFSAILVLSCGQTDTHTDVDEQWTLYSSYSSLGSWACLHAKIEFCQFLWKIQEIKKYMCTDLLPHALCTKSLQFRPSVDPEHSCSKNWNFAHFFVKKILQITGEYITHIDQLQACCLKFTSFFSFILIRNPEKAPWQNEWPPIAECMIKSDSLDTRSSSGAGAGAGLDQNHPATREVHQSSN